MYDAETNLIYIQNSYAPLSQRKIFRNKFIPQRIFLKLEICIFEMGTDCIQFDLRKIMRFSYLQISNDCR